MPDKAEPAKSRIYLVDDHPMVREHLAALIRGEPDLDICGEAADAPTAIAFVSQQRPDLVILDLSLKRSHGLELLKDLQALVPGLPVLILSMHDESLYAERAFRAGAMGYITKEEATSKVLSAIRKVLKGEVYVSDSMAARILKHAVGSRKDSQAPAPEDLSDRELEVYELIGKGHATRQIADELNVGVKTVESYKARIREKLRLVDGTELLQHAIQWVQSRRDG